MTEASEPQRLEIVGRYWSLFRSELATALFYAPFVEVPGMFFQPCWSGNFHAAILEFENDPVNETRLTVV
jgi:hypothetical protein